MKGFLSYFLRFFISLFVFRSKTYYIATRFIIIAYKCRVKFFEKTNQIDFRIINNFMVNLKMRLDVNSYMGGSIYWVGFHHIDELLYVKSYLKPDMTFIDIGANQGEFTLFAASRLEKGKVISFEPVNKQLGYLKDNIALNKFTNIAVFDYGLSDKPGNFPIYTSTETESHSGINEGLSTLYKTEARNEIEQQVELKVFDEEFHGTLSRLDFIKIDIEGAELFALKGMREHLKKFKPQILLEINSETFEAAGYATSDLVNFLNEFGYHAFSIFRGKLMPLDQGEFKAWGNYLFK